MRAQRAQGTGPGCLHPLQHRCALTCSRTWDRLMMPVSHVCSSRRFTHHVPGLTSVELPQACLLGRFLHPKRGKCCAFFTFFGILCVRLPIVLHSGVSGPAVSIAIPLIWQGPCQWAPFGAQLRLRIICPVVALQCPTGGSIANLAALSCLHMYVCVPHLELKVKRSGLAYLISQTGHCWV